MRSVLAVVAAILSWGTLSWIAFVSLLAISPDSFSDGDPPWPETTGIFVIMLALTPLYSTISGILAARIAKADPWRVVQWAAGVNLSIGIWAEISNWSVSPVWFHILLLLLVVPFHLLGGRLAGARRA